MVARLNKKINQSRNSVFKENKMKYQKLIEKMIEDESVFDKLADQSIQAIENLTDIYEELQKISKEDNLSAKDKKVIQKIIFQSEIEFENWKEEV